jgi:hypothetical protein
MTGFLTLLASDANMCNCDGIQPNLTDEEIYGQIAGTPCSAITVDLLKVYQKPVNCYLNYKLWGNVGSSEGELQNVASLLEVMIGQKIADPNDCTGMESLVEIRSLVDRIVKKGVCL